MRALTVILVVIGTALLATSVADAHRINYRTTAVLTSGGPTGAKGKVGCTTRGCPMKCRAGRKVRLFRSNETGGADQQFGMTVKTKPNGSFSVNAPLLAGDYYVEVAKLVLLTSAAHRHSCAAFISHKVRF